MAPNFETNEKYIFRTITQESTLELENHQRNEHGPNHHYSTKEIISYGKQNRVSSRDGKDSSIPISRKDEIREMLCIKNKEKCQFQIPCENVSTFNTLVKDCKKFCLDENDSPLKDSDLIQIIQLEDGQDVKTKDVKDAKNEPANPTADAVADPTTKREIIKKCNNDCFESLKYKCLDKHHEEDEDSIDSGISTLDLSHPECHSDDVNNERDSSYESSDERTDEPQTIAIKSEPKEVTEKAASPSFEFQEEKSESITQVNELQPKEATSFSKIRVKRNLEYDDADSDLHEQQYRTESDYTVQNGAKKFKWSVLQMMIIENVIKLLDLKGFENSSCYENAVRFANVMIEMLKTKQLQLFLESFAHATTCKEKHGDLCFMFKRIMAHISKSDSHECAVKEVYGHVLRLHLDTCKSDPCCFPKCKILREMRQVNATPKDSRQKI